MIDTNIAPTAEQVAETFTQLSADIQKPHESKPIPMLNLGCGTIILPAARPDHHGLVDEDIYGYPEWYNVDKIANNGVDQVFDLFTYPWPLADNSFAGALASHLAEHIPHEIRPNLLVDGAEPQRGNDGMGGVYNALVNVSLYRWRELEQLQNGFFAFFSELSRVLIPGAIVHVLSPYGMSTDAFIDPTHTRYLFPHTFQYFQPSDNAPFSYNLGSRWEQVGQHVLAISPKYTHLLEPTGDESADRTRAMLLQDALDHQWNVANAFYIRLKNVK